MLKHMKFFICGIGAVCVLLFGSTVFSAPVYPSFDKLMVPQTGCLPPAVNEEYQPMLMSDDTPQKPLTHQKLLTILIEFNDVEIKYGAEYWSKQMFDTTPGALSVVNYWKENSNGLDIFEPADTSTVTNGRTGTVSYEEYSDIDYTITKCPLGLVKVRLNMLHPLPTGNENQDRLLHTVHLAVQAIENDFDFTDEQPHIVTIFAGYGGEKPLGSENKGHVHSMTSIFGIETSKGINLGRYTIQGELLLENVPRGIGAFCHELGHSVFNLPDLYFNGMSGSSCGIYNYSLMSYGSHGQRYKPRDYSGSDDYDKNDYGDPYARYDGHVPVHLDPWCKIKCGFIKPTVVNDWKGDINCISDRGTNSKYNVVKVQSKADPKQYFLIENRQFVGFDNGLEVVNYPRYEDDELFNGGILIYHIDENVDSHYNNNTDKHRFMNVERSNNGDGSKFDDPLWVYLKTEGRNRFNAQSAPNSNFHEVASLKGNCSTAEDCHPQIVESGISIEVLSESSTSMQVSVNVEDKYKIQGAGEKFSEVFPDKNFCNAVIQKLERENAIGRNPDDVISDEDWYKIMTIESLIVTDCNIEDMTGIEHFLKLSTFSCNDNQLTKLDLSKNLGLINVQCKNNELKELNVLNCKNLLYLYCDNNLLKELNLSSNRELTRLSCSGNQIEKLNLENNLDLTMLYCYDNYMNDNYELSINKSADFDATFGTSESYKFKYLPQKKIEETPSPTPTAEPSPTPTIEPSPIPMVTPSPTPTATPTLTPVPQTGDRVEFEQSGDKVRAKLIFEKTTPPAQSDIMLIVAYRENGQLKRIEIPEISDMTASFDYQDCDIAVYVWDKNMKPLMEVQKLKKTAE